MLTQCLPGVDISNTGRCYLGLRLPSTNACSAFSQFVYHTVDGKHIKKIFKITPSCSRLSLPWLCIRLVSPTASHGPPASSLLIHSHFLLEPAGWSLTSFRFFLTNLISPILYSCVMHVLTRPVSSTIFSFKNSFLQQTYLVCQVLGIWEWKPVLESLICQGRQRLHRK